jgi:uncharacterized protein (DUF1778 family)
MKNIPMNFRAPPQHWLLIDEAANTMGKSVSDFMFEAAWEKARTLQQVSSHRPQEVSREQVSFVLDADKFRQFVQHLGDQPLRNKGLQKLQATKACWDVKKVAP